MTMNASVPAASSVYDACLYQEGGELPGLLRCVVGQLQATQELLEEQIKISAALASQEETHHTDDIREWLLILCGALVFFMQAGFAMLCGGSVRLENTQNTMLKNLLDACGAAVAYFCVGFALAFGGDFASPMDSTTFVGTENFFLTGDINMATCFFQYTFSAVSVTIVAGTLAERCRMVAYLWYSFFMTGFVYPVVAHAVWSSSGFLNPSNAEPLLGIGMVDFAGSGVVHLTGGIAALFATLILGSRRGRFYHADTGEPLEKPVPFPGHSVTLQMLGGFILWFGWYGFNAGSALLLTDNPHQAQIGARCAINTFLSGSAGCISALVIKMGTSYRKTKVMTFDIIAAMNGCLSGLVAVCAGCAVLKPWAALLVGAVAGGLYLCGSNGLIRYRIDYAVDAIPVHMVNGAWGVLSVGLLAEPGCMLQVYGTDEHHPGLFYSWGDGHSDARLLACQFTGTIFIFGWTLVTMLPYFLWLNRMGWFRSKSVPELVGLDIAYHGVDAEQLDRSTHSLKVPLGDHRLRKNTVIKEQHQRESAITPAHDVDC